MALEIQPIAAAQKLNMIMLEYLYSIYRLNSKDAVRATAGVSAGLRSQLKEVISRRLQIIKASVTTIN